jgi:capsular exopolysaccharide synthesis family protein
MIKRSTDVHEDLRKNLNVEIIPNTHWISVALESANGDEAAAIVNAVVDAFEEHVKERGGGENNVLIKDLEEFLRVLKAQIDVKKTALLDLAKKGNVEFQRPVLLGRSDENEQGPQPSSNLSLDQYRHITEQLMQNDLQIIEIEALLQTRQAEAQQAQVSAESTPSSSTEHLSEQERQLIVEEFKRDPEVASIIDEIHATEEELDHAREVAKKGADPARVAAQKRLAKLNGEYNHLWETKGKRIRQRLLVPTAAAGMPERESIADLKRKLESLRLTRDKLNDLQKKFDVSKQQSQTDVVQAGFLKEDLNRLYSSHDLVTRKVDGLKFNKEKAEIRIARKEKAMPPKAYYNNKQLKYVLLAAVGMMFGVLGLFLLLEIKSERVADPDQLSSRVHSEVFALPPVPMARGVRRLGKSVVDDQLERFLQRLDHLRFAVCGDHHGTEMGRCVLITSSVQSEGKTTLAAHLAIRCGTAGISTLLIDADLHRAEQCRLLAVPEGLGLTDVLTAGAKFEEVVMPIQGETFSLLSAGTPVKDSSRVLQGRDLPMLIAQLRQRYEMIIIDSPPVLPVPDALILGRWTDGALLATRFEISRSPQVERARRQLDNAGIPVLGIVINGMRISDTYYGHYMYSRQRVPQPEPSSPV